MTLAGATPTDSSSDVSSWRHIGEPVAVAARFGTRGPLCAAPLEPDSAGGPGMPPDAADASVALVGVVSHALCSPYDAAVDTLPADAAEQYHWEHWEPEPAISLFTLLNTSGTGVLTSLELKPFAVFTGLTDSDSDWEKTFCNTCRFLGCPGSGLYCLDFARLLGVPDLACYCASVADLSARLEVMRVHLSSRVGGVVPLLSPVPVAPSPLVFQHHNALLA